MEQGWITGDDFADALARSGSTVTPDQIERWRREGLLPSVRQVGHGRGRGSHSEVPQVSVRQAQTIAQLYALRRKREWVGWQLWLNGFEVAEHYWREPLENARKALLCVREAASRFDMRSETQGIDASAINAAALTIVRGTALIAPIAKLPSDMVETLIGYGTEISCGEFTGFSTVADDSPDRDLATVIEALGAVTAERHSIDGHGIDFKGQIESALQEITKAISRIIRQRRIAEPSLEARQEIQMGLEIGIGLNQLFKSQFGRNALGLGVFNRIASNPAIATQAAMLLIWGEYRQFSRMKLPFSEIGKMRNSVLDLAREKPQLTTKI